MKRVYKCEYCYLKNAKPCYECSACMSGDDHFRPAKPKNKQMTNADRIRAMSDEELAAMLKDYKDCNKNCIISNGKHCYQICEEESVLLKWLKQPAEGE